MKEELINSIKNKEFKIYLQPKFDTITENIVGAEALIRKEKNNKVIMPNEFIKKYEKNGLIKILDIYVLEEICMLLKKWKKLDLPLFPISINCSGDNFRDLSYLNNLKEILKNSEINPKLIELELTETAVIEDIRKARKIAKKVKEIGAVVSMDDFGTGYSSFNVLKDIEIDILKIDKCFFDDLDKNHRARIIIESIVEMCKKLEIKTVAEGIENIEQVKFLRKIKCDIIQGFYYSKPISISEYEKIYLYKNKI